MEKHDLIKLVNSQLEGVFMCNEKVDAFLDVALERLELCFSHSSDKYYQKEGETYFSPYHSGQYSIFLYYLANTVWKMSGDERLRNSIYYLNKALNSVDWYYELELPEVFGVEHALGSILGRAEYSNYLFFYQGCTIGGVQRGVKISYPTLGEYVTLSANSSILGECKIGNYVIIGAGSIVQNEDVPDNCIVFGISPNLVIKQKTKEEMVNFYLDKWKKDK